MLMHGSICVYAGVFNEYNNKRSCKLQYEYKRSCKLQWISVFYNLKEKERQPPTLLCVTQTLPPYIFFYLQAYILAYILFTCTTQKTAIYSQFWICLVK